MYSLFNNSLEFSGNNTTITRISNLLKIPITNKIQNKIIGIHAYKFGKLVYNKDIEYILIIGGTDIYNDILDNTKQKIIIESINNSKYIIAFNKFIYDRLISYKINKDKIIIIPQSVSPSNVIFYNLYEFAYKIITSDKSISNIHNGFIKKIFLMVGNVRPVKDPMFVKNTFKKLWKEGIILLVIGNILEGDYNFEPGMFHVGPLDSNLILSFYSQANGLINCSKSEGMSSSILEAMINRCVVFGRNIEGNLAIISNNINGFIFSSDEELYKLIKNNKDNNLIKENAIKFVNEHHNGFTEKQKYSKLLK